MDEKSKKDLLERVNQVNTKKEETITFKIEFEGKVLNEVKIPIGSYSKDVLKSSPDLYYFFKDTAVKLEEFLAAKHKELIWKEMGKQ